ncbi:MAG TPA: hypothetical protein VF131_11945 [Blastocatellia bacterium]|nr:hypothetical protein [Blastocatellia bacterium]
MYDFFNFTTADHHDHHHGPGTTGSGVDAHDGKNSNSESTHEDEDHNHHNQEKESKEMNRTIKNSSAPILTAFALSLMFIFSWAFTLVASDKVSSKDGDFDNAIASYDLRADNQVYNQLAQYDESDAVNRSNYDGMYNAYDWIYAGGYGNLPTDYNGYNYFEADCTYSARIYGYPINYDNGGYIYPVERYSFTYDNDRFNSYDDYQPAAPVDEYLDVIGYRQTAGDAGDNGYSFYADGFSRSVYAA